MTKAKGILHGNVVELLEPLDAPEGAEVEVTVGFHHPSVGEERTPFEESLSIEDLIEAQKVKLPASFEQLLGDFWPAEETSDAFLEGIAEWRHEGENEV